MGPIINGSSQTWRNPNIHAQQPPDEFLCPIGGHLMLDPVNVSSGHTLERTSVQICKDIDFVPILRDGTTPDFSGSVNPNRNIRAMIQRWCYEHDVEQPRVDYYAIEEAIQALIAEADGNLYNPLPPKAALETAEEGDSETLLLERVPYNSPRIISHALTLPHMRNNSAQFNSGSFSASHHEDTPLNFKTTPASYSPQPGPSQNPRNQEHEDGDGDHELLTKLMSSEMMEQEEGVTLLRNLTRTDERAGAAFCTPRLLSVFRPLILSRSKTIQVNAVASLVNLSLEKHNKTKLVGAGLVPPLIEVLRSGFPESQEHAAGALFSLSLEADNQTAIGVLGALDPLLASLKSESDRTRHDSALALYHLSLNQTNRTKLVNLGAVPILLDLMESKNMAPRAILVLCNLALSAEGKSAMLDADAVMTFVTMLRENEFDSDSTMGNVVGTLCAMSQGSLRFTGVAREAGAVDVLRAVEMRAKNARTRERARRMLQMMKGAGEEVGEEDVDGGFGRLFESGGTMSYTRIRRGARGSGGQDMYTVNTARF